MHGGEKRGSGLAIHFSKEDMTMRGKWFATGLLAAVGVLAWSGASRGGDTIRLNMVDQTPTKNLVDDGQGADTIRTWHRGFGWGGWGYRGFGWGWGGYRGFGLGYGGFYRPFYGFGLGYGGFYRPYFGGLGFYRPYYGLGFYRPYYGFGLGYGIGYGLGYSLGYGGFGYGGFYPGFGIGYSGFFWPCAGAAAGVYTLNMPVATLGTPLPAQLGVTESAPQQPSDGTFPYDGGPTNPVPNLKDTPPSSTTPPRTVPLEGRSVSLPKATPKWTYPAYGETARRATPAPDRTYLTRGESKKTDSH
jgi:hypothetical protein